ncbi:SseB family protein [Paracoccus thiocyanatus]|uniref:SseB family protein n=1 Tax=Paracoccus thiocyanatus TaxID=34006 RepID=UPI0021636B7F|nr:SseB family protein [Paracoccus thiocyanatus]
MTPLDEICQVPFHQADAPARARILSRLADTELFAALLAEPAGDRAELRLFDLAEGRFALACDREERLAGFVGGPVAYVALPGRVLARALAQEGRGLLVNPGDVSQLMLDAQTLGWLVQALEARPALARAETRGGWAPPRQMRWRCWPSRWRSGWPIWRGWSGGWRWSRPNGRTGARDMR